MSDNITILVKLFETLKESSDKNEDATQQLIVQQLELVGHIKHLPIEDLKQALKEHAKDSSDNIGACTETVEVTGKDLMEEIKKLSSRVSKMILVVLVTFTVLTGTYVFISNIADHKKESIEWKKKIEEAKEEMVNKAIEEFKKGNNE
ncbi:hypothetical protein KAR91_54935 [Candidatus Pacearchaeota archaeon]|nr:hypothetical protein [Candidatus Pacearchaeota archaeon]